ncbi:MAG: [protein-PII] uridylyltransferase, partial [Verrucomicrobiota bacterium]|nr:[protein-PII] uridylyltransferase [Verrucomicrobiota bacterium]
IIQLILYMLWDIGFKVGHSTRSIAGAIKQANSDALSKTSFLETRIVCGDGKLFEQFKAEFLRRCVRGQENDYIEERVRNQAERHAKYGNSLYLQEPNVKNGCGGLRDYQNVLWISFFKERLSTTAQLVEKKFLQEAQRRRLDGAYDFLLRVRTELHYANKRATDLLSLPLQFQIANKFNYPQKNPLGRSEAFMRDYYQHTRNIFFLTDVLAEKLSIPKPAGKLFGLLPKRKATGEHFDGFYSLKGAIFPESRDIFTQDPHRLMRLFQHAQQRGLKLSTELQQLVRNRLHLVDRTMQYSRASRETFAAILSRKGEVGRIMRMMHEVDFLGRYIPEFGALTCLVQHEFFHRYTADEHTLVCMEKLDRVIDTADPRLADYKAIFQKFEDPYVLYLALLLHDTGKASSARHHAEASALFAQKVAARLQLSSERRKALIFLVDDHLLLSSTAQRRNIDDAATISEFANLVKTQTNLDGLMLLTLVDGQGTGDENWSDWKESLVWRLYRSTSQYLADGAEFFRQRKIERDQLRETVSKKLAKDFEEEVDAQFQYMPDIYFQSYAPSEVASHIRLFRSFMETRFGDGELGLAPAIKWSPRPERSHTEVCVCTWDRQQLFAKIAGAFAVAQLNILSADIYTRADSLVLDIFRVCNTQLAAVVEGRETALVEKHLQQALESEDYDFGPLLEKVLRRRNAHLSVELDFPTRIMIDNNAHPIYTLIDIQTPDRLGLLYHLLSAFSAAGANIALSRISTEKGAAIDSFYVTNTDGRKIRDAESIERLQAGIKKAAATAGV